VVACALVAGILSFAGVSGQTTPADLSQDDMAILRLAFADGPMELSGWTRNGIRPQFIPSTLSVCDGTGCIPSAYLQLDPAARSTFIGLEPTRFVALLSAVKQRNAKSWSLEKVLADLEAAWPPSTSPSAARRLASFVQVSLPGYSADRQFALLYMTGFTPCAGDCEYWWKTLGFVRRADAWIIVPGGGAIS
jgi:hypothetical protein